MKQIFSTLILILIFGISHGQDSSAIKAFENLCDSSGLQFTMPEGYNVIEVKKNRDLVYSFAAINADSTMEIRYTIWSLKPQLEKYKKSLKDSNSIMVPPNNLYKGIVQANMLNMTGGKTYDIGSFSSKAVKKEFNADAGGSCFFKFHCHFGKGYKYGQFVYLHKDDVADVIVTFMSNNKDTHADLMKVGFHSLKFK